MTKTRFVVAAACGLVSVCAAAAQRPKPDVIPATGGDLTIVPITHGTLEILYGSDVILVDPSRFGPAGTGLPPPPPPPEGAGGGQTGRTIAPPQPTSIPVTPEQMVAFKDLKPPTLILVTDVHEDHLDPGAILALRTPTTRIVAPAAVVAELSRTLLNGRPLPGISSLANGATTTIGDVSIEAVAMYNTKPDAEFKQIFHTKGRGNGYIVTVGGKRLYIAGDTACTPEMKALKNIDVAFLPMNLPFTMSGSEAAECALAFRPKIVYPYHHDNEDVKVFDSALKGKGIEVRLRDWYLGQRAGR